jgi:hypothetical protein
VGVDEAPVAVQADPVVTTGQSNAGTVFKRLPVSCRWFCLEFAVLPEDSAVVDTFRWQIGGLGDRWIPLPAVARGDLRTAG